MKDEAQTEIKEILRIESDFSLQVSRAFMTYYSSILEGRTTCDYKT